MHQPETRKYHLFPKERQLPVIKAYDPEQACSAAMSQPGDKPDRVEEKEKKSSGLRMRIKEHNLIRRRKVSLADLGPMTTVQEVPMDSPTIPGRPALHERSISSPVNTYRQHNLVESVSCEEDTTDESSGMSTTIVGPDETPKAYHTMARQPLSPKSLAPLVIPAQNCSMHQLARQLSLSRSRSGSTPTESALRSARTDESPWTRTPYTPFTPSSYSTAPNSALTTSTLPTPVSACPESRDFPRSWENMSNMSTLTPVTTPQMSGSECSSMCRAEGDFTSRSGTAMSHRRNVSETSSIMERGRPRKRSDGTPVGATAKRTGSKRDASAERRAFEVLPQGFRPTEAAKMIDHSELDYLQKQALGQALRFEVLKKDDVESLSKELRHLDERTEYLRRTYTSLRAGRRNLHSRICQYLRSPRTARFSHESMLKQEEALAELDTSIDDWVTKLEAADNRRTRVRQKLLEHVAAAATMACSSDIGRVSETLQLAMGGAQPSTDATDISTPPRSPSKTPSLYAQSPSPSPHRFVPRVPSVIPEAPCEEAATVGLGLDAGDCTHRSTLQQRMESIRIYADSDVYALLADVESEFTKLSGSGQSPMSPEPVKADLSEEKMKELHRARSHEMLHGFVFKPTDKTLTACPPAPPPPLKDSPTGDGDIFLTAAVFNPGNPAAAKG
ncbi:Up-regulated during septation-domain-containing protein [Pseudomassariella vexata]|uniref:Up-regulated during septation-domain-containing protein n=1 Tax=Pseudomassariella vexata TaxID=1141098 RepID=A0A1Y2E188_9PEZI|nr:Up-regulated during septation-domain-containing protein [Pseudomassariella vexata]ORY65249.1 Up-regulated during septation-domain-containing protein [Pseudomassariella vexata]